MRALKPLSGEERAFAEEHHDLVGYYLRKKGLSEDEYYDVVIFGYLVAVQEYLGNAKTQAMIDFETLGCRCMKDSLSRERRYWCRKKRAERPLSLDCIVSDTDDVVLIDTIVSERHDTEAQAIALVELANVINLAKPHERPLLPYLASGITASESAPKLGIGKRDVYFYTFQFRKRIRAAFAQEGGNYAV